MRSMKQRFYVLKNIKGYLYHIKWDIVILIFLSLISLPITIVSPVFFQILVDDVMYQKEISKLLIVVVGMVGLFLLRFFLDGISLKLNNRVHNSFVYLLRKDIFQKYKNSSYSFISKKEVGELKMRIIDDVDIIGNFISEHVVNYLYDVFMLIFTIVTSSMINWQMTLLCLLILPVVFAVDTIIGDGTKQINEEIRTVNSKYFTSTHNSLQFWREIKTQNLEELFIERFCGFQNILARLGVRSISFWAYKEVFTDFKNNYLTKVLVYIIGAFFVMKQQISVGTLIMFSEYFSMLFSSLESLNTKRISLKTNSPYYERIFDTFSFPEDERTTTSVKTLKKGIQLENVKFSYLINSPVLKDINLQINKGNYIAIVGKTGCGKTTLARLLLGLYEKDEGKILFDDIDITQINRDDLYSLIGAVMQDSYLFNVTIRENLLIAKEDATVEDMIEACKKANIYDFISQQPNGFDTIIGERGVKLSGGQKQRISIAIVMLRDPQIVIFDEATSSLDGQSEAVINDAIKKMSENKTVIVIAHKPSTILKANKIIVMEEGRVTAQGTHEELINNNKYYTKLMEDVSSEK